MAETAKPPGSTESPIVRPRILRVSRSIFTPSSGISGTTFPRMSSEGTPGYPAPETACIVVTKTCSRPKLSMSGASAIARKIVEQFAFVTMAPVQPRRLCWCGTSERDAALISGMTRGTSSSMRWAEALEKTNWPRRAHSGSSWRAVAASSAEKMMRQGISSAAAETVIAATGSGSGEGSLQRAASA